LTIKALWDVELPKRRTRYEIYADLLDLVSRKGVSRVTRASYGANLPVDRAKEALGFLASRGFLKESTLDDSVVYRITSRGREYLETFRHMRKLFAALDQESREVAELMPQLEAALSTSKKDVTVNENFSLAIKLTNNGSTPITLTRIEGITLEDLKIADKPQQFVLKEGYLDTGRMVLDSKKSAEVILVVRPRREGSLSIKPRVVYVSQTGREFFLEPEHAIVNVAAEATRRVSSGFDDLDKLLLGGIPETYSVILTSPPCDERDLLTARFVVEGVEREELTFYITVDANILKHHIGRIQPNLHVFIFNPQADSLIADHPNVSKLKGIDNLTDITITLTSALRRMNKLPQTPRRAYVEILSDVLLQHGAVRTRKWMTGILATLKSGGFTSLMMVNPQMHSAEDVQAVLDPFEGEIDIYEKETKGTAQKVLRIRRMLNQRYLENEMHLVKENLRV
jgi:predicted transcriptional regulator/KaiC/GvpD/RAD55 family RecA-like ATPase